VLTGGQQNKIKQVQRLLSKNTMRHKEIFCSQRGGGGGAGTPVRGYVLTRWAENHDSVIRNATRIHVMHSSLSSFFQEPGARCNNTEMALHQVLVHSHGHQVMYLFLSPL